MGSIAERKVLVIGLDCAAPELVFDRWAPLLPNISRLMGTGLYGRLESTTPPITVPAWMSMMTSKDPGQLGLYGFRNRRDYSYDGMALATSLAVKEDAVWDILSRAGKTVTLIGVPPSYPPKPVNGHLISCFMTPDATSQYTYPPSLKAEVEELVGEYLFDAEGFRSDDKERILKQIYLMTEKRFTVARHLMQHKPWDFFMLVEIGVDRIHHGFWKYFDERHRKHQPGSPFEHVIRDYYIYLDGLIGDLLALTDDQTAVLIVSDHGAKRLEGGICINEWLMAEGYLTLKEVPSAVTPFGKVRVEWERTRAWGEGGYYGRLFLNVKGREPNGTIDPSQVETVRDELIERLETITDDTGRPIGVKAFKPERIYAACRGIPPDLIVYFGDLSWRSVGSVGYGSIWTFENDTGPDDANHAQHGIFIVHDPRWTQGRPVEGARIMDIAPTILTLFGFPIPQDMQGRSILSSARVTPSPSPSPPSGRGDHLGGGVIQGFTIWFTGLSGSGKTTVSRLVEADLRERGLPVEVLDGDVIRQNLSQGLGFTKADRDTNIQRIAFVSKLLTRNHVVSLVAAISPYREAREAARKEIGNFVEVYVKCPLETCIARDAKGLYKKAIEGTIPSFTGISDPYEEPLEPEVILQTDKETPEQSTATVLRRLRELNYLP